MAKKEPAKVAAPAPVAVPEPVAVVTPRDRLTAVGLDRGRDGHFEYIDLPQPYGPERQIAVDGQTFEHCSEDRDGVWLYRHSQF